MTTSLLISIGVLAILLLIQTLRLRAESKDNARLKTAVKTLDKQNEVLKKQLEIKFDPNKSINDIIDELSE